MENMNEAGEGAVIQDEELDTVSPSLPHGAQALGHRAFAYTS